MKAFIVVDVPEWQIGQEAKVYFSDSMLARGICIAIKEKVKPERLLPCVCGSKRREHWYDSREKSRILKCSKCKRAVSGKNEIEVHKKWNEMIKAEEEKNNG